MSYFELASFICIGVMVLSIVLGDWTS